MKLQAWTLEVDQRAPRTVTLPADLGGQVPHADTRYRLRTEVALPRSLIGRKLRFALPSVEGRVMLEADGELVPEQTATWFEGYRRRGPIVWTIDPDATRDGAVTLVIIVDSRWSPARGSGSRRGSAMHRILIGHSSSPMSRTRR